jgi:hypothetical protein
MPLLLNFKLEGYLLDNSSSARRQLDARPRDAPARPPARCGTCVVCFSRVSARRVCLPRMCSGCASHVGAQVQGRVSRAQVQGVCQTHPPCSPPDLFIAHSRLLARGNRETCIWIGWPGGLYLMALSNTNFMSASTSSPDSYLILCPPATGFGAGEEGVVDFWLVWWAGIHEQDEIKMSDSAQANAGRGETKQTEGARRGEMRPPVRRRWHKDAWAS